MAATAAAACVERRFERRTRDAGRNCEGREGCQRESLDPPFRAHLLWLVAWDSLACFSLSSLASSSSLLIRPSSSPPALQMGRQTVPSARKQKPAALRQLVAVTPFTRSVYRDGSTREPLQPVPSAASHSQGTDTSPWLLWQTCYKVHRLWTSRRWTWSPQTALTSRPTLTGRQLTSMDQSALLPCLLTTESTPT